MTEDVKTEEVLENEVLEDKPQKNNSKKTKKCEKKYEEEINKIMSELATEKEKTLRIQAEMMNFRKRKEDEVINIRKYANEDILKELLLISDNFERALSMENDENKEFLKGFRMIHSNILNILKNNEVVEINALNEVFDPNVHQAVMTEKKDDVEPGIVIEVLQKGYMYKDRVLRTSMVKVSE